MKILSGTLWNYVFCFFVVASSPFLCCQVWLYSTDEIPLARLVKDVIENNSSLKAANERIESARIAIPRVQVIDDPQFTFRTINNSFRKSGGFIKEQRYNFSQRIPFPGKLRLKGEIAEAGLSFLLDDRDAIQQELRLQTKRLYFQLFLNSVALEINEKNRAITLRIVDGALASYKVGRGSQSDVLKAQIELQILDEELLQLENERVAFTAAINALLDRPPNEVIDSTKVSFHDTISFDYSELEVIAMRMRPELKRLEAQELEAQTEVRLAKRNYFPDFDFEFMIQNRPETNKRAWGFNVSVNLPFWAGQKQYREVQEARAKMRSYSREIDDLRSTIRGRIKTILAAIEEADERITLYKTGLITKTAEALASYEFQYRVGKGDFLLVLDTRRQLQNIELDYEHVRIQREILLAELEREIGMILDDFIKNNKRVCIQLHMYKESEKENTRDYAHKLSRDRLKNSDGEEVCGID